MTGSTLPSPSWAKVRRLFVSRTGVLILTTAGTLLVRMISSVTLTRLLSPDAYGLVGIIMAIFTTVGLLTDLGFQAYIIRHERGDDDHFLDVLWTIHSTRGVALTVMGIACAPLVALALAKPGIGWPFAAASLTFGINGIAAMSLTTALRKDGARFLSILDLVLQVFQMVCNIAIALLLRSVWAIIVTMILQECLRTALSFLLFPKARHRVARDKAVTKDFLAFSRVIFASNILTLLIAQTDKLLLARLLTLQQFGLYAIALNLVSAPVAFATSYVARVAFPVYSKTWRDDRSALPGVYYSVRRLATLLYAFGCGGLIGGSRLIVVVLYDPRYERAGFYFALLMIGAALRLPNFAASELMMSIGEIKMTLRGNIVRFAWYLTAGPIGYWLFKADGVIAAVGLVELPTLFYSWSRLRAHKIFNLREETYYLAAILIGAGAGYAVSIGAFALRALF